MAVITLHKHDQEIRNIPLGNYLDLSTQIVGLAGDEKKLKDAQDVAPEGAVLATGSTGKYKIKANVIGRLAADFDTNRRYFDRMTWENTNRDHVDVETLDWKGSDSDLMLNKPGELDIGTRLVIQIAGHEPKTHRYYRVLVHGTRDIKGEEYDNAFSADKTTLQIEELIPGRILVPLGIQKRRKGYRIVTSKNLPVQYVTKETSELAWTIRPVGDEYFEGAGFYFENFPVVRVDFRPLLSIDGLINTYAKKPMERLPWIDRVVQENRVSRSFSSSMYRIVIRHEIKISEYGTDFFGRSPGASASSPSTDSHRYAYDLYLADGSRSDQPAILDFDPDVDVEDEL